MKLVLDKSKFANIKSVKDLEVLIIYNKSPLVREVLLDLHDVYETYELFQKIQEENPEKISDKYPSMTKEIMLLVTRNFYKSSFKNFNRKYSISPDYYIGDLSFNATGPNLSEIEWKLIRTHF
jgi:hypothetical protein